MNKQPNLYQSPIFTVFHKEASNKVAKIFLAYADVRRQNQCWRKKPLVWLRWTNVYEDRSSRLRVYTSKTNQGHVWPIIYEGKFASLVFVDFVNGCVTSLSTPST